MLYKYLIFVDKRFRARAKRELESLAASAVFDEKEVVSDKFIVAELGMRADALLAKLAEIRPIFIENIVSLIDIIDYKAGDYGGIISLLVNRIERVTTLKLEVLNLNSKSAQNAKSIEVKIGQELESAGFRVDMFAPESFIYIVLSGDKALICKSISGSPLGSTIDYFRKYNNRLGKVSRAEFKLEEAMFYFGIDTKKVKSAIDIGAAPGGWSKVFSSYGIKVTAIDNAPMVYKSPLIKYIQANAAKVDESTIEMADMLLIDANTDPKTSSGLAIKFAKRLNGGGHLLLTVKLVGGSVEKHIEATKEALSQEYTDIKFKKLPHNRLEIACFAVKR